MPERPDGAAAWDSGGTSRSDVWVIPSWLEAASCWDQAVSGSGRRWNRSEALTLVVPSASSGSPCAGRTVEGFGIRRIRSARVSSVVSARSSPPGSVWFTADVPPWDEGSPSSCRPAYHSDPERWVGAGGMRGASGAACSCLSAVLGGGADPWSAGRTAPPRHCPHRTLALGHCRWCCGGLAEAADAWPIKPWSAHPCSPSSARRALGAKRRRRAMGARDAPAPGRVDGGGAGWISQGQPPRISRCASGG